MLPFCGGAKKHRYFFLKSIFRHKLNSYKMDESDFNKLMDYEPYFSNSLFSLPPSLSSPSLSPLSSLSSLSCSEKDSESGDKDDDENDDFSCASCDVFCKCPENVGMKKKCYYCLWSTTCARFEMICANCTCDLKFCLCKKPVRITKAEFTRLYYVTD